MTRSRPALGAAIVAVALVAVLLAATACSSQRILGPPTSPERIPGAEFKNHGYTWYLFFGTIPIVKTSVIDLISEKNPNRDPIHSWKATSQEDWLCCLVNFLNFGGVLVSLHSVDVEGRYVGP
jgi:hypothetical protein